MRFGNKQMVGIYTFKISAFSPDPFSFGDWSLKNKIGLSMHRVDLHVPSDIAMRAYSSCFKDPAPLFIFKNTLFYLALN